MKNKIPSFLFETDVPARLANLERELHKIDGVVEVEFDLDGFLDKIWHVILLVKYDIPVNQQDYFALKRANLAAILKVCKDYDLFQSGDVIEDYGEHWYIVRNCGVSWPKV